MKPFLHTFLGFFKSVDKTTYYSVFLAAIGILLVFIVPPFQTPDEQTHLYRAYQLSEGELFTKELSYGAGSELPKSLSESFEIYRYLLFNDQAKINTAALSEGLQLHLNESPEVETRFENTAVYPPVAYLPQIVAISIGRLFDTSPVVLLYLARFANLVAWITVIAISMRRNKRVALPIFAFSLLPIVAFQAASASADVITAALSLFVTLEIFRSITNKKPLTKNTKLIIIISSTLLAFCKFPYALLTLLVWSVPKKMFKSTKERVTFKLLAGLLPTLLSLVWIAISYSTFVNLRAGVDTGAQIQYILFHPVDYIHTLFNTYVATASDGLYIQMIGQLGWLDTKLPFWTLLVAFSAVLFAVLSVSDDKKWNNLTPKIKLYFTTIGFIIAMAVSGLLYLTWNPPGASFIDGLQGRYYIPLIGIVISLGVGFLGIKQAQEKRFTVLVYVLLALSVAGTLSTLIGRYYAI